MRKRKKMTKEKKKKMKKRRREIYEGEQDRKETRESLKIRRSAFDSRR